MKTKVTLQVGKADLGRIGFTERMRRMIEERLPKFFPETPVVTLNLEKIWRGNLRWTIEEKGEKKRYVKMACGKRGAHSRKRKLDGRREAMFKFIQTQNRPAMYALQEVFFSRSEWVIVEVLELIEGAITLDELLKRGVEKEKGLCGQGAIDFLDCFQTAGKNLAENVRKVHVTLPTEQSIGTEMYQKWESRKTWPELYHNALRNIVDRLDVYASVHEKHPIIGDKDQARLREIADGMLSRWLGKESRLSLVHGDLNSTNVMVHEAVPFSPDIILIDFSPRVHLGEPRWDDGRLVADLLQLHFETGSGLVRKFIDSFINTSEYISGDTLYREGLCWGVFAMTLLKLFPKGRPIKDEQVATRYLENSFRILEQGYFSWE